ncbi:hypothetical protein [Roseovarius sp.]|uniref:hypothetical protein n=1 Tax=Roseovarius sp. TaxID=1486281 RepID=UPI0025E1E127|nr:hypothetical protein [Roseovarius sp.]
MKMRLDLGARTGIKTLCGRPVRAPRMVMTGICTDTGPGGVSESICEDIEHCLVLSDLLFLCSIWTMAPFHASLEKF